MPGKARRAVEFPYSQSRKHALLAATGFVLGGVFLWLATRDFKLADVKAELRHLDGTWFITGVTLYWAAIGLRCLRWGLLLRVTDNVKWRHAAEALVTGFAANYALPARVGELFRASYARRVFNMDPFTSLGTIVVERTCDGVILVCAIWISFSWVFFTRVALVETAWILGVGAAATILFGAAVVFIRVAQRIDLRRFGVLEGIATRWDGLVKGVSSVLQGDTTIIVLYSIAVWAFEVLALTSVVRSFHVILSPPETLLILGLASLSTLLPTAPGYVGTYQLVFGYMFRLLGHPETVGIVAASAIQIFCFGSVTIFGGIVLLSRSGFSLWRAHAPT